MKSTYRSFCIAGKHVQDGTALIILFYLLILDEGKSKPPNHCQFTGVFSIVSEYTQETLFFDKSKNRQYELQFQKRGGLVCLSYFKGHYHLSIYKWTSKPVHPDAPHRVPKQRTSLMRTNSQLVKGSDFEETFSDLEFVAV